MRQGRIFYEKKKIVLEIQKIKGKIQSVGSFLCRRKICVRNPKNKRENPGYWKFSIEKENL